MGIEKLLITRKVIRMKHPHFLVACFPVQGHINPSLQLAKNLARLGASVTFATTLLAFNLPSVPGLSYTSFSDGHDHEHNSSSSTAGFNTYMADLRRSGSKTLTAFLTKSLHEGRPVTCIVYSLLLPWASAVASDMNIPSALLAIQCASAFAIYHRFFNRHDGLYGDGIDSSVSVSIHGLPLFSSRDLPTFLLPDSAMSPLISPVMQEHVQELERVPGSLVLLNTFEELEPEAIRAFDENLSLIAVGPLIPSAFADGTDSSDKSFGGDLFSKNEQYYFQWLDEKPAKSVVYVAFGSLVVMSKEQKIEILQGLLQSKRPFMWVNRSTDSEEEEDLKKMLENDEGDGIIVQWCSQMEVLSHKSVGCFVTHCGWNSTMEGVVSGVPLIGCPHFSDQTTNAKLVEEVWGNGVRARENGEILIKREEIAKYVEIVMGNSERGKEIKNAALKWRGLAAEAVKDGGSTYSNMRKLLEINI